MASEKREFVVDGEFCAAAKGKSCSGACNARSRPEWHRRRCGDNGIAARGAVRDPGQRSTMAKCIFPSLSRLRSERGKAREGLTRIGMVSVGREGFRYERGNIT